ncbi:hypothetical protein RJ639_032466, partial [Escallonia herrerae]
IRDFHIAKREEDIGYYAGYVGSSFMLGRALTSFFWGLVADRYGRKPVIIIGTSAVVIFNTLFGLSTNFWMAICTRFLLGSLNGLLGPIKAYASEVFSENYQALGLSTVSVYSKYVMGHRIDHWSSLGRLPRPGNSALVFFSKKRGKKFLL